MFHEITGITNILNSLTNEGMMKHLEATSVHHKLGGRKAMLFYTNVARLFNFLQSRHNEFVITSLNVPLHNIVTQMVATEVTCRFLKAFETGERLYQEFRNERFKTKTVKLSATIYKISLPRFDIHVTGDKFLIHKPLKTHATNLKQVAAAQHIVEIAKERGKTIKQIMSHDLIYNSPFFDRTRSSLSSCTKPEKAQLIVEMEKKFDFDNYCFDPNSEMKTNVGLDFMSKIRQYPDLSKFPIFWQLIKTLFCAAKHICESDYIHLVFLFIF